LFTEREKGERKKERKVLRRTNKGDPETLDCSVEMLGGEAEADKGGSSLRGAWRGGGGPGGRG